MGDSGLGKSALLYQAAMCVAHDIPFLGFRVTKGRVLYLDFENGLQDVQTLTRQLARHLGIDSIDSDNMLLWNYNDPPHGWSPSQLEQMIEDLRPDWIIMDPIGGFEGNVEASSENATALLQRLRGNREQMGCRDDRSSSHQKTFGNVFRAKASRRSESMDA